MKEDKIYFVHIKNCIERIEQYTKEGREAFMESTLIQDGVIRNLQTLGQSILKISDVLKAKHPEIDWRSIIGFRNVLVHGYLGINLVRVWEIVENDLPDLKKKVSSILKGFK